MTAYEQAVAAAAARGFVPGATVACDGGDAEIIEVTDRGVAVKLSNGSACFISRGTYGYDRIKVIA